MLWLGYSLVPRLPSFAAEKTEKPGGEARWATHHVTGDTCLFSCVDLKEQALDHAVKGCNILLSSGDHVMSHDPSHEATYSLAQAQCVVGRVLTSQGKYPTYH